MTVVLLLVASFVSLAVVLAAIVAGRPALAAVGTTFAGLAVLASALYGLAETTERAGSGPGGARSVWPSAPSGWSTRRRGVPAPAVAGVPDDATVYVCWTGGRTGQGSVTVYEHDGAYWVTAGQSETAYVFAAAADRPAAVTAVAEAFDQLTAPSSPASEQPVRTDGE